MIISERIERAAVKIDDDVFSLPKPKRHHDVLRSIIDLESISDKSRHGATQGFLTSKGRFVDRSEGFQIAKAARQIKTKHGPKDVLFSEDMW